MVTYLSVERLDSASLRAHETAPESWAKTQRAAAPQPRGTEHGRHRATKRVWKGLRNGTLDSAKLGEYIRAGFDVNAALNRWGLTALHIAAHWGRLHCIEALVAAGANVNATGDSGQAPLHSAAGRHVDCIVALLAAGADPNVATRAGRTPLHKEAARGSVRGVSILLAAGANTEVWATRDSFDSSGTPLTSAAMSGNPNALPTLLRGGAKNCIMQIERDLEEELDDSGDAPGSNAVRRFAEDLRRARRAALLYLRRVAEAGGYLRYERRRRAAVMAMAVRSSKLPAALEIWVQHVADSFQDPLEERELFMPGPY